MNSRNGRDSSLKSSENSNNFYKKKQKNQRSSKDKIRLASRKGIPLVTVLENIKQYLQDGQITDFIDKIAKIIDLKENNQEVSLKRQLRLGKKFKRIEKKITEKHTRHQIYLSFFSHTTPLVLSAIATAALTFILIMTAILTSPIIGFSIALAGAITISFLIGLTMWAVDFKQLSVDYNLMRGKSLTIIKEFVDTLAPQALISVDEEQEREPNLDITI